MLTPDRGEKYYEKYIKSQEIDFLPKFHQDKEERKKVFRRLLVIVVTLLFILYILGVCI